MIMFSVQSYFLIIKCRNPTALKSSLDSKPNFEFTFKGGYQHKRLEFKKFIFLFRPFCDIF